MSRTGVKGGVVPEDLLRVRRLTDVTLSPGGERAVFTVQSIVPAANGYAHHLHLADLEQGTVSQLTDVGGGRGARWSPTGPELAFLSSRAGGPAQVWLATPGWKEPVQLTQLGAGVTDFRWSPDGRRLVLVSRGAEGFRRTADPDTQGWRAPGPGSQRAQGARPYLPPERLAPDHPLFPDYTLITNLQHKFTAQGYFDGRWNHLYLLELADLSLRQLTAGNSEERQPAWSPDGQRIVFATHQGPQRDRHQRWEVWQLDVTDGSCQSLTGSWSGSAGLPAWSPQGSHLAFIGTAPECAGYNHAGIWVMAADGTGLTCLTRSLDRPVGSCVWPYLGRTQAPVWSADGREVFFAATDQGEVRLFSSRIETGECSPLPLPSGVVSAYDFSRNAEKAVAIWCDSRTPDELWFCSPLSTGRWHQVSQVNSAWAQERQLQAAQKFTFLGADDWPIDGWVMPPVEQEQGQTYPLILEIHGGPHNAYGNAFSLEFQQLCAAGYGVLYTNPRGSGGYPRSFTTACIDDWGGKDYLDLMAAVDEALTWNWVDPARLGAIGGSYGGYMTSWLAGHTQRFAGIITERVVTDRYSYFGTTDMGFFGLSRTYGGPPWEREEKYYFHSPIRYVKNMTTPMLIVHGEQDLRHTMEQAEQLFTFLKRLGRPVEFVRFHSSGWGEDQNLSAAGRPNNRLARYRIILEWLGRHLGGAGERKEETPWKQASAR